MLKLGLVVIAGWVLCASLIFGAADTIKVLSPACPARTAFTDTAIVCQSDSASETSRSLATGLSRTNFMMFIKASYVVDFEPRRNNIILPTTALQIRRQGGRYRENRLDGTLVLRPQNGSRVIGLLSELQTPSIYQITFSGYSSILLLELEGLYLAEWFTISVMTLGTGLLLCNLVAAGVVLARVSHSLEQ